MILVVHFLIPESFREGKKEYYLDETGSWCCRVCYSKRDWRKNRFAKTMRLCMMLF